MGLADLEPLLATGPWAFVLVVTVPIIAIVVMFLFAIRNVPAGKRAEVIRAMAELVRALWRGKGGPV